MATAPAVPKTKIAGGSFLLEERNLADVFTPEDFSDEHRQIARTTEEFATNEILPLTDKIEAKDFQVTRDLLKKGSDLGLCSVDVPEQYGGMELDKVSSAIVADYILRQRRAERAHQGRALAGRQALSTQRRKDVDHQRACRRRLRCLREDQR
jgi:butyryl-CoA dehydrogenase